MNRYLLITVIAGILSLHSAMSIADIPILTLQKHSVEREDALDAGHIEFKMTVLNPLARVYNDLAVEQVEVVESGAYYFEWGELSELEGESEDVYWDHCRPFRIGKRCEPDSFMAISDGIHCLTEEGSLWHGETFTSLGYAQWELSLTPEAEAISIAMQDIYRDCMYRLLHPVKTPWDDYQEFISCYTMVNVPMNEETSDWVEESILNACNSGKQSLVSTQGIFAIDNEKFLPTRAWYVRNGYMPLLAAEWLDPFEIKDGIWLSQQMITETWGTKHKGLLIKIELYPEDCWLGAPDPARFEIPQDMVIAAIQYPAPPPPYKITLADRLSDIPFVIGDLVYTAERSLSWGSLDIPLYVYAILLILLFPLFYWFRKQRRKE